MATGTAQERQKCIWGYQNSQNHRTRLQKCDLGDLGAPRCSKVPKTHFGDLELSEQQNPSYTYATTQKCVFEVFCFFEKVSEIVTFSQMRFGVYFADVFGGSERSNRAKSLKWDIFTTWRSKMTQVHPDLCFPR